MDRCDFFVDSYVGNSKFFYLCLWLLLEVDEILTLSLCCHHLSDEPCVNDNMKEAKLCSLADFDRIRSTEVSRVPQLQVTRQLETIMFSGMMHYIFAVKIAACFMSTKSATTK